MATNDERRKLLKIAAFSFLQVKERIGIFKGKIKRSSRRLYEKTKITSTYNFIAMPFLRTGAK